MRGNRQLDTEQSAGARRGGDQLPSHLPSTTKDIRQTAERVSPLRLILLWTTRMTDLRRALGTRDNCERERETGGGELRTHLLPD